MRHGHVILTFQLECIVDGSMGGWGGAIANPHAGYANSALIRMNIIILIVSNVH